jgi:putative transposase
MQPEQYYHVYNRGNNKEKIFYEEKNYKYFLEKFDKYLLSYIHVFAYCLMPTHFHFFIRMKEIDTKVSRAFKNFFISYAKSINIKYKRTGSLFQANFKKKEFANDCDFCNIILYIHLNPVKAGLCKNCTDWKYSSYNAFISGKSSKINVGEVMSWFRNVEQFVKAHDESKDELSKIEGY